MQLRQKNIDAYKHMFIDLFFYFVFFISNAYQPPWVM